MSVVDGGPNTAGIVSRVQNILLKPQAEWDVIEAEPATIQGLFTGYAMILAAIPAVASIIGSFLTMHNPVLAIVTGVLGYIFGLIGVFAAGFIIDALATSFGGEKNPVQAMKVAVYSSTATWIAGVLNIIPFLGLLVLVGMIYGLYIMFLGLPKLMKVPEDKKVGYFVVVLVVEVVVYFGIGIITAMVLGMMALGAAVGAGAVH